MNLKKFYYKDYFKPINFNGNYKTNPNNIKALKSNNKRLCEQPKVDIPCPQPVNVTFRLKVEYPGLVTGVGIGHEANIEGEFKLGMHFDHTYGMPVIYGSSVKGVLRAYLNEVIDDNMYGIKVKDIEKTIFDGENLSSYERDVFFDAVIVKSNGNGRILAPDSITPHKDALKNPIPLTFVKIAPGCTLEFRFRLRDSKIGDNVLSAEEKIEIFKNILTTFGIGAKTNVGYGQLSEVK